MHNGPTTEIVLFKLNADAKAEEFVAAAREIDNWLRRVDGFVDRELSCNADGQWVDIVHWQSLAQAHAAAEQIMSSPEGQRFGGFIDGNSILMLHTQAV